MAAVDATTTTTTQESKPASVQSERLDEKPRPSTGETELVQEVTSLLKSLRASSASIKVCNLKRIQGDEKEVVLLDGGATKLSSYGGDAGGVGESRGHKSMSSRRRNKYETVARREDTSDKGASASNCTSSASFSLTTKRVYDVLSTCVLSHAMH